MRKSQPPFQNSERILSLSELSHYADGWLLDCEIRQHSKRTRGARRQLLDKLLWFLRTKELADASPLNLRAFLAYCSRANEDGGRWGNARQTGAASAGTVATYHRILRAFFNWIVSEGGLLASPMQSIAPPVNRPDQIEPFTEAQVNALLASSRQTRHPRRDEAVLLFLLDTGVRASELCGLRFGDLDMNARRATVQGKGNKSRPVYFGGTTAKALWQYLKEEAREPGDVLFKADRGTAAGEALTRNGLFLLFKRLGKAAKIEAARCSPHTARHTFAVSYLRNGGDQFSLMQILGHSYVAMTQRYVNLAAADVAKAHRQFSPMDRLKKK